MSVEVHLEKEKARSMTEEKRPITERLHSMGKGHAVARRQKKTQDKSVVRAIYSVYREKPRSPVLTAPTIDYSSYKLYGEFRKHCVGGILPLVESFTVLVVDSDAYPYELAVCYWDGRKKPYYKDFMIMRVILAGTDNKRHEAGAVEVLQDLSEPLTESTFKWRFIVAPLPGDGRVDPDEIAVMLTGFVGRVRTITDTINAEFERVRKKLKK
jgi:hypothetical protein